MTKRSATARSYPVRIQRVPVGPLAPTVLAECRRWLAAEGYSPGSAAAAVNLAMRLSAWMEDVGAGVGEINEGLLDRFIAAERSRDLPCSSVKRWMGALRRFLAAAGYLRAAGANEGQVTPAQAALTEWCSWMRIQRGLTEKSVARYCYYAAGLLDAVTAADGSVTWDRVTASMVNVYVADRGRPYGVAARAHIVGSVRCLLRWALSTGRLDRDVTAGILKACRDQTVGSAGSERRTGRGATGRV